ncbi:hypothetical protein H9P43_005015 [Blastocladiella emersonii ATCC 22665]|nr:hypothetical protein H9P43_005015 [Blastocladiella emersonii ATCC 22665]
MEMSGGLAQLPNFAKKSLFNAYGRECWSVRDIRPNKRTHDECVAHHVDFAARGLFRRLIVADLDVFLTILTQDSKCMDKSGFWELVPNGALDAVRDAAWIQRTLAGCKRASTCIEQLKRVAPAGSAQQSSS